MNLELPELEHFYGSTQMFKNPMHPRFVYTEGVRYVMQNGYSWLIDLITASLIEFEISSIEFSVIDFNVDTAKSSGSLCISEDTEDGVPIGLHCLVPVPCTDAKRSLKFFLINRTLMLTSEY